MHKETDLSYYCALRCHGNKQWFPSQRASNMELWWLLCCWPEQIVGQTIKLDVIWGTIKLQCKTGRTQPISALHGGGMEHIHSGKKLRQNITEVHNIWCRGVTIHLVTIRFVLRYTACDTLHDTILRYIFLIFYYTPRTTKLLGGYITSSFRPSVCPACRVRSVTSTVLNGFFPY